MSWLPSWLQSNASRPGYDQYGNPLPGNVVTMAPLLNNSVGRAAGGMDARMDARVPSPPPPHQVRAPQPPGNVVTMNPLLNNSLNMAGQGMDARMADGRGASMPVQGPNLPPGGMPGPMMSSAPMPPQRPWDLVPGSMGTAPLPPMRPDMPQAPHAYSPLIGNALDRSGDSFTSSINPNQMASAPLPPGRPGGFPRGFDLAGGTAPLPPMRPADIPAPGAMPTVGRQSPQLAFDAGPGRGPGAGPGAAPAAPSPASAPSPAVAPQGQGWEYYRYLDEMGRPVWGTRAVGTPLPANTSLFEQDGNIQAGGSGSGLSSFLGSLFGGGK